ncbi:hypothetical protein ACLD0U_02135 [Microbacterium sp. 2216-1]|uniref:hypothetical protein n=1 Tax=Microbacterium sp. 2216-1 TaxID=3390053 RepID=UPI0039751793
MPHSARRRELERRAYAPGGGLTDAEAHELQVLSRREPVPQQEPVVEQEPVAEQAPVSESAAPEDTAPEPVVQGQHTLFDESAASESVASDDPASEDPASGATRRRWLAPLAILAALVLGFGGGWLVFGRGDPVPMTDAQRESWAQLRGSGDYDDGSIQLLGAELGADAWYATRQEETLECLVLTVGERTVPTCEPVSAEGSDTGLGLHAVTTVKRDGEHLNLWASLGRDVRGELTVLMQYQSATWDWRSVYSETELPIAEFLDAAGYDGQVLQVMGYDGDTPIWLHQSDRACILVATADELIAEACGQPTATEPLGLVMPHATYSVLMTDPRGPVLTVIRDAAEATIDDTTGDIID